MVFIDTLQLSFLIAVPVVGLIFLFLLYRFVIATYIQKKYFQQYCYKKVYKVVQDNDYYLINNFEFNIDESNVTKIDHIVFGDKFIYICTDKYYEGNIMGRDNDQSLVLVSNDGKKDYIDNVFTSQIKLIHQFASVTNISTELLIGLVIVNNNCQTKINSSSKQLFLLQANKVKKIVKLIENRDVKPINAKALEKTVQQVARNNMKGKKKMAKAINQ